MSADRSARLAQLIERLGGDLDAPDVRDGRAGRLRRVQDAWLRGLAAPAFTPGGPRAVGGGRISPEVRAPER
jgi:hypothetical protein